MEDFLEKIFSFFKVMGRENLNGFVLLELMKMFILIHILDYLKKEMEVLVIYCTLVERHITQVLKNTHLQIINCLFDKKLISLYFLKRVYIKF